MCVEKEASVEKGRRSRAGAGHCAHPPAHKAFGEARGPRRGGPEENGVKGLGACRRLQRRAQKTQPGSARTDKQGGWGRFVCCKKQGGSTRRPHIKTHQGRLAISAPPPLGSWEGAKRVAVGEARAKSRCCRRSSLWRGRGKGRSAYQAAGCSPRPPPARGAQKSPPALLSGLKQMLKIQNRSRDQIRSDRDRARPVAIVGHRRDRREPPPARARARRHRAVRERLAGRRAAGCHLARDAREAARRLWQQE